MDWLMYILVIIIVICLLLIWFISTYNHFQNYIIRINEAEVNIDSILRKRFDLLNKSIGIIKANVDIQEEIMEVIVKLRSRKLSNFELDRLLYDAINEFHQYEENYEELKDSESFVKIDVALNESEPEISAARKYYNDIITDYNKLVRTFPSNIVAKMFKYKIKPYFDGKNMEDDIVNDFKL
ncbi:MAG: LemA family protein [Mollicutes bacterium]|nr:LemA family protein [Mollicutes bacterium]